MSYKQTLRDIIYSTYFEEANMSLNQLLAWKKNPRSNPELRSFLNIATKLRFTKKGRWEPRYYKLALRAITYIRKLKKDKRNKINLMSFGHRS